MLRNDGKKWREGKLFGMAVDLRSDLWGVDDIKSVVEGAHGVDWKVIFFAVNSIH